MTDDLLKRMAQTIYDNCGMRFYRCEDVAKEIIDAHLRLERGERTKASGVMWATGNRYTVHRWVTEWQADDE